MCTVTVVAPGGGPHVRVMCNRDEQRSRPQSLPPQFVVSGSTKVLMPIDPISGGTWIGVNDAGLIGCLLNARNSAQPSFMFAGRASRGSIVPEILRANSIDEAAAIAGELDPSAFPPFRLLIIDQTRALLLNSDGVGQVLMELELHAGPLVLSSSGLGDHLVTRPREDLFVHTIKTASTSLIAQRKFHENKNSLPGHLAVLMSRADARTVSRTMIDLFGTQSTMQVEQLNDDLGVESWRRESLMIEHSRSLALLAHT